MRKSYDETIVTLNKSGLTNKEIAAQLDLDSDTVTARLKKFGLKSNFRTPIQMIDQDTALCKKCGLPKNIALFQTIRRGKANEYKLAYCNECRNKQIKSNLLKSIDTIDKYLTIRYKELIRRARRESIICSITQDNFIKQYHLQNGLCFYTGENMICEVASGKHRNSFSIDKIIPNRGYVKGNVVFCVNKINVCKNDLTLEEIQKWMPDWFNRIEKFLNECNG